MFGYFPYATAPYGRVVPEQQVFSPAFSIPVEFAKTIGTNINDITSQNSVEILPVSTISYMRITNTEEAK